MSVERRDVRVNFTVTPAVSEVAPLPSGLSAELLDELEQLNEAEATHAVIDLYARSRGFPGAHRPDTPAAEE